MQRITYAAIEKAVNADPECHGIYLISAVGGMKEAIAAAVNQGIDGHLEALTSSTFNDCGYRLECKVSAKDMPVLLRRLQEMADDEKLDAEDECLVSDILGTLGIVCETGCFEIVNQELTADGIDSVVFVETPEKCRMST